MQTTKWGQCAWDTFFIFSRNYPGIYDPSDKEHVMIRKHTKQFYYSLNHILPCKYCRASYKEFWKILPIEDYLCCKNDLTYWLYKLKDLVNEKLIKQEKILFDKKLSELKKCGKYTKDKEKKLRKKIFFTKPSPSFESVLKKYDRFRAKCSDDTKSCRKRLK